MSAKLAMLAAMLGAAVLAAPFDTQQAAYNASSAAIVKPIVLFAFDQERIPAHKSRAQQPRTSGPIIINVFPNMAAPAEESEPHLHEAPAVSPHRIQSPGERAPSPQPQFSPRLRPPNGKTDGKIYPA